jgi:hypothetical protein
LLAVTEKEVLLPDAIDLSDGFEVMDGLVIRDAVTSNLELLSQLANVCVA